MKLILALLFAATSSISIIGAADTYTEETVRILMERREAGEFGSLELQELTSGNCRVLAGNIQMGGAKVNHKEFVKECTGKSISLLQQIESPELPLFIDVAVVTYINYGNLPYAVENPEAFFANGNFFFEGIVATATTVGCNNYEMLQSEKMEVTTRFMVNELIAYDVRVTYREMGIISIRYFLSDEYTRYDYNYTCE